MDCSKVQGKAEEVDCLAIMREGLGVSYRGGKEVTRDTQIHGDTENVPGHSQWKPALADPAWAENSG